MAASKDYGWEVRLVNLQELLDSLDIFRKITGIRMQDVYNLILKKGWTLGSSALVPVMHGIIRLYHPAQVQLLSAFWRQSHPDMVVSLIPNFNRAIFEGMRQAGLEIPLVTILTDLADYPPHFWMENQPQYFVCGTHEAVEQALNMGHPKRRVFQVSGMILRPEFYAPQEGDRRKQRERLGLDPDVSTGLVLFGGEGSNVMFPLATRLGNSPTKLQLILICGRNDRLRERLKALKTRNTIFVEGFTKQIPYYMHLADFFIGKPGPGSISESLKMNLPVIVERNSWTLPQERFNADWVKQQGVGVVLDNFREIESTVKELLEDGRLQAMRRNIECVQNRAVFEIPPILAKILSEHPV